jgi:hypothetical protein
MEPFKMSPFAVVFSFNLDLFFIGNWLSGNNSYCVEKILSFSLIVCLLDESEGYLVNIGSK